MREEVPAARGVVGSAFVTAWDGAVIATTERLVLRTFRRDDLPLYAALNADPDVYAFLGGVPLPREESDAIAEWAQQLYVSERIGLLAVERRADGAFLGMCGLHHQESYREEIEIGWRFARKYWNQGYATEAASRWLDLGFGPLGFDRIISITEPDNVRSLAVMRRLGMEFDHAARVVDGGIEFDAIVHSVTAERWQLSRS
jgi:RimJ/RimL family protein N-acetyltransferase